jgi:hypothetical protein
MNKGRLLAGGLVAGIIINIAEGILNGAILGEAWKDWAARTAAINQQPSPRTGMLIWTILALALGFLGVWMYAAVRPRFGSGPRTALKVAFFMWLTFWVSTALQSFALGNVPRGLLAMGLIGGLIGIIVAMLAGAAIYKEGGSSSAQAAR